MYASLSRSGSLDALMSFKTQDQWVQRLQTQPPYPSRTFGDEDTCDRLRMRSPQPSKRTPLPMRQGPSPTRDRLQSASLCQAAKLGDAHAVRRLLAWGADPNRAEGALTPLTAAASLGRANIVRILLDSGAWPNHPQEDGKTALALARGHTKCATAPHMECGCHEVILMLITAMDAEKRTAATHSTYQQVQPRAFVVSRSPSSRRLPEFVPQQGP